MANNSPPKLGEVPSEARRGGSHGNHPVFAHFVREASPPNLGGEFWLYLLVVSLAAAMLASCGGARPSTPATGTALEKTHLTIGVAVPAATYLPLYVAVDEGTFAKQGLEADVVEFRGGSDLIRAVVSTSVDVGVVSLAEITSGIDAGQPLKAFYGKARRRFRRRCP